MQFLYSAELLTGLRIAKPIYNQDGVLLYNTNARLTPAAITNIHNLGLSGVYILEPAEQASPLTQDDIDFEQAQAVYFSKLKDVYEKLYKREKLDQLESLVEDIINRYGTIDYHLNFNQNIRTSFDFMYKHATSTSIICAILGQRINMSEENYKALIASAILYCFGHRFMYKSGMDKQSGLEKGIIYLGMASAPVNYLLKATQIAEHYILSQNPERKTPPFEADVLLLSEILKVAVEFDLLTQKTKDQESLTELAAITNMRERTTEFNINIVNILAQSMHMVPAGATVILNTNEKAVVLEENSKNYMQPIILRMSDHTIYDLANPSVSQRFQIADLPKTEDNRIAIAADILAQYNKHKNTQN